MTNTTATISSHVTLVWGDTYMDADRDTWYLGSPQCDWADMWTNATVTATAADGTDLDSEDLAANAEQSAAVNWEDDAAFVAAENRLLSRLGLTRAVVTILTPCW